MKTKLERWARPRRGDRWIHRYGNVLRIVRVTKQRVFIRYLDTEFPLGIADFRLLAGRSIKHGATFKPAK